MARSSPSRPPAKSAAWAAAIDSQSARGTLAGMVRPRWQLQQLKGRKIVEAPSHYRGVDLSDPEISAEIIEACRVGDRVAFRTLYDTYKDRVYSIALYFFHGER